MTDAVLALAMLVEAATMPGSEQGPESATELPRARDGDVAIRQELDAARKAGTLEAYDLFIARHPQHPLAEIARREREALALRPR